MCARPSISKHESIGVTEEMAISVATEYRLTSKQIVVTWRDYLCPSVTLRPDYIVSVGTPIAYFVMKKKGMLNGNGVMMRPKDVAMPTAVTAVVAEVGASSTVMQVEAAGTEMHSAGEDAKI